EEGVTTGSPASVPLHHALPGTPGNPAPVVPNFNLKDANMSKPNTSTPLTGTSLPEFTADSFNFEVIGKSQSVPVLVCFGASWYLPPKQTVLTRDGPKCIESIAAGDIVLSRTGFVKVLSVSSRHYDGLVFRIEGAQRSLEVTAHHPVAAPGHWLEAHKLR